MGDYEGTSLCKLAKVYEKLNEPINVAIAYDQFTEDTKLQRRQNQAQDLCQAYKYLANFYLKKMKLDNAYEAASKCLEFPETRQEAQTLLNQIAQTRNSIKDHEGGTGTGSTTQSAASVTDTPLIGASNTVEMEIVNNTVTTEKNLTNEIANVDTTKNSKYDLLVMDNTVSSRQSHAKQMSYEVLADGQTGDKSGKYMFGTDTPFFGLCVFFPS